MAERVAATSPDRLHLGGPGAGGHPQLQQGRLRRANNVELAYTPHSASWLNHVEAQFTALRHFCLDGTDHESHEAQAFLIRRYIAWRNRHAQDRMLREVVKRVNVT